ncbi:MAG: deoxyribonuclease IV [Candidatus Omnitrophica bacterium]|nr:deoxyribonuclease IV [Candidatus Omnitrophota bacterium]
MGNMRFGFHVSIAGGLHRGLLRAVDMGCDTAQFFLVNPRGWRANPLCDDEIERFLEVRSQEAKSIRPLAAHMPYLPNLASMDQGIFKKSIAVLRDHLIRCDALKIDFLVLHMGKGERESGILRMAEGIKHAFGDNRYHVVLLLENTAGQGREIGSQLSDFQCLYDILPDNIHKGICFDTCHALAAGYDVTSPAGWRKIMREFKQYTGINEVRLLHINDALKPLGSRVDRHAQIGEGFIGKEGFRRFFSKRIIQSIPCILETPRVNPGDDLRQLKLVRSISSRKPK